MTRFVGRWRRRLMISALATTLITMAGFGLTAASAQASGPCYYSGGTWFADTCWGSPHWIKSFTEEYAVPKNPSKGGATFAIWGGLENGAGNTVLQGVLNWDGSSWSVYPEYQWSTKDYQGTHISAAYNDTITSTLTASSCSSSGACTWTETVKDSRTGQTSTSKPIGSDAVFTELLGGVLEIHSISGCIELPASDHIAFRDLKVVDSTGTSPTPVFGPSTPDPQCSMKVQYSSTSADFIWTP
ncbi:MAG TPA: hypothetical protein VGI21_26595 [Streptosporangiaceae bacterium]|jgi:hypothetical protein